MAILSGKVYVFILFLYLLNKAEAFSCLQNIGTGTPKASTFKRYCDSLLEGGRLLNRCYARYTKITDGWAYSCLTKREASKCGKIQYGGRIYCCCSTSNCNTLAFLKNCMNKLNTPTTTKKPKVKAVKPGNPSNPRNSGNSSGAFNIASHWLIVFLLAITIHFSR